MILRRLLGALLVAVVAQAADKKHDPSVSPQGVVEKTTPIGQQSIYARELRRTVPCA
jgi:hypothetical protein